MGLGAAAGPGHTPGAAYGGPHWDSETGSMGLLGADRVPRKGVHWGAGLTETGPFCWRLWPLSPVGVQGGAWAEFRLEPQRSRPPRLGLVCDLRRRVWGTAGALWGDDGRCQGQEGSRGPCLCPGPRALGLTWLHLCWNCLARAEGWGSQWPGGTQQTRVGGARVRGWLVCCCIGSMSRVPALCQALSGRRGVA